MGKKGEAKVKAAEEVVTREYTIHMRKLLHGVGFKKRAPKAVDEVKKFAKKMMGTEVRQRTLASAFAPAPAIARRARAVQAAAACPSDVRPPTSRHAGLCRSLRLCPDSWHGLPGDHCHPPLSPRSCAMGTLRGSREGAACAQAALPAPPCAMRLPFGGASGGLAHRPPPRA